MPRYLEDYPLDEAAEFGGMLVTEAEIRAFAERFDPQPFHTDAAAAAKTPYGGLIASGWHTAGIAMRLMVDHYIDGETSLGSPGIGNLRWRVPVRPGDTLRVRARVTSNRPSETKPDRGIVVFAIDVLNQHGEIVMSVSEWIGIVLRRPQGATHGR